MNLRSITLAGVAVLLLTGTSVRAATVTDSEIFAASFSGGPEPLWLGQFTVTFDPTASVSASLDAFSSNLPLSYGTFSFITFTTPALTLLAIGDDCGPGFCAVSSGTNTALFSFSVDASGALTPLEADISGTGSGILLAQNISALPADPPVAATPLPATLPLFAGGLGVVGYLARRRKKNGNQPLSAA